MAIFRSEGSFSSTQKFRQIQPRWVNRTANWLTRWFPVVFVGDAVHAVGIISKIKSKINSIRNSDLMKDNSQSKL